MTYDIYVISKSPPLTHSASDMSKVDMKTDGDNCDENNFEVC